ncbi:MAG: hypothetical protein BGO01_01475 [Armatimonadetes bacterium 55-13]|nr:hypothetical protein [Armatimonadota bacterium]OJU65618.1 MAG: hypothetical protein BGO01_01475 [Armatimonadetes bacterium 55-13]
MTIKVILGVVGTFTLLGCGSTGPIGNSEINKAYPKQSQAQLEEDLKRAGKYDEYMAGKQRDAAVEQGQQ